MDEEDEALDEEDEALDVSLTLETEELVSISTSQSIKWPRVGLCGMEIAL